MNTMSLVFCFPFLGLYSKGRFVSIWGFFGVFLSDVVLLFPIIRTGRLLMNINEDRHASSCRIFACHSLAHVGF